MKQKIKYGIVQGRLIQSPKGQLQWFPQDQWEDEFSIASSLGLNFIELIAERQHNKNNPIWTDEGVKKIKLLVKKNNLELNVICNDYIIDNSLLGNKNVFDYNLNFIKRAELLGMKKMILPLFEKSEITEENVHEYKDALTEIADIAEKKHILVCLETILSGQHLLKFLDDLDHKNIKCVFDTGNRIVYGHDIYNDIRLLGDEIKHIHIKDKNDRNENVLLGTGKVNFYEVFNALKDIGYEDTYTFETYRGRDPIRTARYNMNFIDFFIKEVFC